MTAAGAAGERLLAALLSRQAAARVLAGFGLLFLALTIQAQACTICLSAITITPAQKLDSADQAVIAFPLDDPEKFRVIDVIKGEVAVHDTITEPDLRTSAAAPFASPDGLMPRQALPAAPQGKPLLLVRDRTSETWTSIGAIDGAYAEWLRELAATKRGKGAAPARRWPQLTLMASDLSEAEWRERVAAAAPQLESAEPLVAEIAYGEIARAPYGAMMSLKSRLDRAKIASWAKDPKLASRQAAYILLLGIVGGPDDALELEKRIDASLAARDATDLSAMLAADLELRGPARVDWLEQTFFAERHRTLPEIKAALLALSAHGGADATVPRSRVIEAYRRFIELREPMAGLVAMELADWKAWNLTEDYVAIVRSQAVKDPAGEFAVLGFLKRSPLTARTSALVSSPDTPKGRMVR